MVFFFGFSVDLFHDVVFEHVYPDVHSSSVLRREWGEWDTCYGSYGG